MSRSAFRLLVTSALSAAILLIAYTVYLMWTLPDSDGPGLEIPLAETVAVAGDITPGTQSVTLVDFEQQSLSHYALLSWRYPVSAEQFALVEYTVQSGLPGLAFALAWRRADDPDSFHSVALNAPPSGKGVTLLARHPEWRGDIIELALQVLTNTPGEPATLQRLALAPSSFGGLLAALRDSWLHFSVWNHFSINSLHLEATRTLPPAQVAAASWAVLSITLLLLWNAIAHGTGAGTLALAALVPWLAIDVLWQKKLWHQLAITSDTFAGKTPHEKQLADMDEPLYSYAQRLRENVLPEEPARILLLHNSNGHNFARLRMQYYLLPHNVYNFDQLPPEGGESSLDYVLLLGNSPPSEIAARGQRLVQDGRSIAVELLNQDNMGYLFRVLRDAGESGQ
jgi:hypothetical protein